jgi:DNA-directed RNA polymerase specialized sigma subunit
MDKMLRENEQRDGREQHTLLDQLFRLESRFKDLLLSHDSGKDTYQKFMKFILEDKGNILSARVYFRERQDTFSNQMFKAFHKSNSRMLHKFRINYTFMQWCLEQRVGSRSSHYSGPHKKQLVDIFEAVMDVRRLLCENNLPLAINRAKIFWNHVAESHLEYMDLVQASSEGLLVAIDKFVPPYGTVFRSTAIGRMGLNMSTDYMDTIVKIPPKEKRILYRARLAKRKQNITENAQVVSFVNESFQGVTTEQLAAIQAAAGNVVDLYKKPEGGDGLPMIDKLSDGSQNAEERAIQQEVLSKLFQGMKVLKITERKVVRLKHGDLCDPE